MAEAAETTAEAVAATACNCYGFPQEASLGTSPQLFRNRGLLAEAPKLGRDCEV